jgi:hypothetical protein
MIQRRQFGAGPFRITTVLGKTAFVLGLVVYQAVVTYAILPRFRVPYDIVLLHGFAAVLLFIVIGIRVFRGRGEPVEPPRPWWKASARPTASLLLGGISSIDLVLALVILLTSGSTSVGIFPQVLHILSAVLTASLYLNSGIRLAVAARKSIAAGVGSLTP